MNYREHAQMLGLEEDEFVELIELFFDTCSGDVQKLEGALADHDAERVSRVAHSMKGASSNLGFSELSGIAKVIEISARQGNLDGMVETFAEFKEKLSVLERTVQGHKGAGIEDHRAKSIGHGAKSQE